MAVKAEDEDKRHHKTNPHLRLQGRDCVVFPGDQYIKDACKFICLRFKYSPVFRIGGDEFVVILEELDYADRNEIMQGFDADIDKNQREGLVVIASGFSVYDPESDNSYNDVFMRADRRMYERKRSLKERTLKNAGEMVKE